MRISQRLRTRGWLLIALLCGASGRAAAQRYFLFDDGFCQPAGGTLEFDRNFLRPYATKSPGGKDLEHDVARYWHYPRLLCGAPDIRTEITGSAVPTQVILASGFAADGVTRWVVDYMASHAELRVYQDGFCDPPSNAPPTLPLLYRKVIAGQGNTHKQGISDLLLGQADTPGQSPEQDDSVELPTALIVAHGVVFAICEHRTWVDWQGRGPTMGRNAWRPVSTSVCFWRPGAPGWTVAGTLATGDADHENSQEGCPRGAIFQNQEFRVLEIQQGVITRIALCMTDYVQNGAFWPDVAPDGTIPVRHFSAGGRVFAIEMNRDASTEADWNIGSPVILHTFGPSDGQDGAPNGFHLHSADLEPTPDGGLLVRVAVGDQFRNNRVLTLSRADTQLTDSGWTLSDDQHGTHVTADTGARAPVIDGNQYVMSLPLGPVGAGRGSIVTGDEAPMSIMMVGAVEDPTARVGFVRLFGPGTASTAGQAVNSNYTFNPFLLTSWDARGTGPFAAYLGQGGTWGRDMPELSRVLYSPDGEHWGMCWATGQGNVTGNHLAFSLDSVGRRLALGCAGDPPGHALGTRSIAEPVWTAQRPLAVGRGGTNFLSPNVEIRGTEGSNVVGAVDPASMGLPPAPCAGPVFRCTRPDDGRDDDGFQMMGALRLTGKVGAGVFKVRMWLYPIPPGTSLPEGGAESISGAVTPEIALGNYDLGLWQPHLAGSREVFRVGPIETVGDPVHGWLPVTLDTDTRNWRTDWNVISRPSSGATFHLGMRIRNAATSPEARANPCDFLVAFDYVLWNGGLDTPPEHAGIALPVGDARRADPERASVTGFACGERWSIVLAGEVPEDAWDQTDVRRPDPAPMVTLWGPDGAIEVLARPATRDVCFRWSNGKILSLQPLPPESFFFLRSSPVLVGVSRTETGYLCAVSVGGTTPVIKPMVGAPAFGPTEIRFSDAKRKDVCPILWYGGSIDEQSPSPSLDRSFKSLDMLYEHRGP